MKGKTSITALTLLGSVVVAFALGGSALPSGTGGGAGSPAFQEAPGQAHAVITDSDGTELGVAELRQTPDDRVLIQLRLTRAPGGEHAIHIHETGECQPFSAAGDHFAPRGHEHGILNSAGKHAGDLPNLHISAEGEAQAEILAHDVSLRDGAEGSLFDEDGSAIVIHRGSDDYTTDPGGDSGPEIACGVVERR